MKKILFLIFLIFVSSAYAQDNSDICSLATELTSSILQKRMDNNQSKSTAKIYIEYFEESLNEKQKDFFDGFVALHLNNAIDEIYSQPISKYKQNYTRAFLNRSKKKCLKQINAYDDENRKKAVEIENKIKKLKKQGSGKYKRIYTTHQSNGNSIHNVYCQSWGTATIIQTEDDRIYSYIDRNGKNYRVLLSHPNLTLEETAKLSCK